MTSIRIAIAALPQLLRDIVVDALSSEPDMELVGESPTPGELGGLVASADADVAIVACERSELGRLGGMIHGSPSTLIAITDEGRRGVLYELCPREVDLGELSPRVLVNVIREVAQKSVA